MGTIFGGSMYGAVDPIYMTMLIRIMLIRRLGRGYVVWDKAASIRFRKPGRTTLHATLRVDDGEVRAIGAALATQGSVDRVYQAELTDAAGVVHATVEKTLQFRRRDAPA